MSAERPVNGASTPTANFVERTSRDRNSPVVVTFSMDSPRSVDDDRAVHSYVLRVSDEEMASTEKIGIEIDGGVYA